MFVIAATRIESNQAPMTRIRGDICSVLGAEWSFIEPLTVEEAPTCLTESFARGDPHAETGESIAFVAADVSLSEEVGSLRSLDRDTVAAIGRVRERWRGYKIVAIKNRPQRGALPRMHSSHRGRGWSKGDGTLYGAW